MRKSDSNPEPKKEKMLRMADSPFTQREDMSAQQQHEQAERDERERENHEREASASRGLDAIWGTDPPDAEAIHSEVPKEFATQTAIEANETAARERAAKLAEEAGAEQTTTQDTGPDVPAPTATPNPQPEQETPTAALSTPPVPETPAAPAQPDPPKEKPVEPAPPAAPPQQREGYQRADIPAYTVADKSEEILLSINGMIVMMNALNGGWHIEADGCQAENRGGDVVRVFVCDRVNNQHEFWDVEVPKDGFRVRATKVTYGA